MSTGAAIIGTVADEAAATLPDAADAAMLANDADAAVAGVDAGSGGTATCTRPANIAAYTVALDITFLT